MKFEEMVPVLRNQVRADIDVERVLSQFDEPHPYGFGIDRRVRLQQPTDALDDRAQLFRRRLVAKPDDRVKPILVAG